MVIPIVRANRAGQRLGFQVAVPGQPGPAALIRFAIEACDARTIARFASVAYTLSTTLGF